LSISGQISELETIIKTQSNAPVTLIGYSWGAWLGWLFAAEHGDLVRKLILLSSGPFESHYNHQIDKTRQARSSETEISVIRRLFEEIKNPRTLDRNEKLLRIGKILAKSDTYDAIRESEANNLFFNAEQFLRVWSEAENLRKRGVLLNQGRKIKCPVIAIHGDYDPHPADGVRFPLDKLGLRHRFFLLQKCGHKPWIEYYAREHFFELLRAEID